MFTIFILQQGAGYTARIDDKVLGYGLNAREARFLTTGAALALEYAGYRYKSEYCTEYYADPNN